MPVKVNTTTGDYIKLAKTWKNGDKITLHLPMQLKVRQWEQNKNSVSVNYGPLTYSLKIDEQYTKEDSRKLNPGRFALASRVPIRKNGLHMKFTRHLPGTMVC
jgi:DUF1680 family protein